MRRDHLDAVLSQLRIQRIEARLVQLCLGFCMIEAIPER
jgi:hypothetical protein